MQNFIAHCFTEASLASDYRHASMRFNIEKIIEEEGLSKTDLRENNKPLELSQSQIIAILKKIYGA